MRKRKGEHDRLWCHQTGTLVIGLSVFRDSPDSNFLVRIFTCCGNTYHNVKGAAFIVIPIGSEERVNT